MATLDDGTWHCMTDAPRDGTEVELLVRHTNFRFCKSDEERSMWEQAARAKWIDFNGGGWTWSGLAGSAVGWRPLAANASLEGCGAAGEASLSKRLLGTDDERN